MKQIWRIYTTDIRNVTKHWAAIVIVLGLAILPSLYAWFNIEASWDPYANTGEVPIAVSNEDKGTNLRGKDINIGNEVVDSLKKNKSLGWQFVDEEKAIHGVEHGDYYASITIPADFSEKIATVISDEQKKPEIQYYVNEKVNAIAPKITVKGATGITEEISKNFVKTANAEIFKIFNELGIDLETNLPSIEKVKELVFKLEGKFPELYELVDTALTDAEKAEGLVKTAQDVLPTVESVIRDGQQMTKNLDAFFVTNEQVLQDAPATIKRDLMLLQKGADGAAQLTDMLKDPVAQLNKDTVKSKIQGIQETVQAVQDTATHIPESTGKVREVLNTAEPVAEQIKPHLDNIDRMSATAIEQVDLAIKMLETSEQLSNMPYREEIVKLLTDQKTQLEKINQYAKSGSEAAGAITENKQSIESALNNIDQAAGNVVTMTGSANSSLNKAMNWVENGGSNPNLEPAKNGLTSLQSQFESGIKIIDGIIPVLNDANNIAGNLGKTTNIPNTIDNLNTVKGSLQEGTKLTAKLINGVDKGQQPAKDVVDSLNAISKNASASIGDILATYDSEIVPAFNDAIERVKRMSTNTSDILNEANQSLPDVKTVLEDASKGLVKGEAEVQKIKEEMPAAEQKIKELANKIREFEQTEDMQEIIRLLKNDVEKQSDYFANPVNLKENKLFPIPNYGSAMSPFYTVLALWVGALLMVSLLTVEVHHDQAEEYKSYQVYFGRLLTFLSIGFMQAFIVTMGNLFILETYVVDKFWFVVFGLFISAVFVCIVYSLVSVFGNIGKTMAIILLVLQVAGSGGTFPIQMTPHFFQTIYPFLPFTYAISVIRETVGGMLWDIVLVDLAVLSIYIVVMFIIALLLKKKINKSSERFVNNAKGSKLIH
ncbi:phage infection protein [Bacillus manliponensis]|uniref:Phage infection protein n=1 Tax=Bacillus manliponensis TaxID=574376 RepID=A0A073JYG2_9BACI|nr:YhgE/Pip domain-containing protein [Bacillus manliponensis]KEK19301.1 phage infection protein [Bacillus manliponensis]